MEKVSSVIAGFAAYWFLGAYLFNIGYFYTITGDSNEFLSFSDVIDTTVSFAAFKAYSVTVLYALALFFIPLQQPRKRAVDWINGPGLFTAVCGVLAFAIDSYLNSPVHSKWLMWCVAGGMMSIVSIIIDHYSEFFSGLNSPKKYITVLIISALITLPLNLINGVDASEKQQKVEYLIYSEGKKAPISVTGFRNLSAGYFVISEDGKTQVISKSSVLKIVRLGNKKT